MLKLPKKNKPKAYQYSLEETLAIIAAAPERWGDGDCPRWDKPGSVPVKLLLRTLAQTGIRPGELAGLRRTDLQGRIITVSQSV